MEFNPQTFWSRKGLLNYLLLPLSLMFGAVAALRRWAYRNGILASGHPGVPVVVVGNLTAGGSGKTPFVIWLAEWLKSRGHKPGVVSRGYGRSARVLLEVAADSTADEVGDEPLLVHLKTGVPVMVGADRLAAARELHAQHADVDVIISDDGLQHYRLRRDLELVMADASARFGNGWLLPSGPLREPLARLNEADVLILTRRNESPAHVESVVPVFSVRHVPAGFRNLKDGSRCELPDAVGRPVTAVTAIARPEGFFALLSAMGLSFRPLAFPDHHVFRAGEIAPEDFVVMTEKDAVKCPFLAGPDWWALELKLEPSAGLEDWLSGMLGKIRQS